MMAGRLYTVAKNTMLLYLRSIIVMLIAIYSARVLLSALGVEDYGLYNLVGGVVSIFSSLKGVFSASVQRFLNYEKGMGHDAKVNEIFNTSRIIHLLIAVIFIVVVECFGLWYINEKMVLPDGSLPDALFVFQCSVLAFGVSIITVPYDAVIVANEKMSFYAWISIIESVAKLGAICFLFILPFNRVRAYAFFILLIAVLMRCISVIYTKRFPECVKNKIWNKETVKELTSFAGWNFFGCMSFSLIEEGANLIINIFGGVVANAARSIAYQIKSAISQLSTNVVTAFQPLLFQEAATADVSTFWKHVFVQTKAVFCFVVITALPFFVYADQILELWLTEVPSNTTSFVRAVIVYLVVMTYQKTFDIGFKAYNKMKKYQILDSVIVLFSLPIIYATLKKGGSLYLAFIILSLVRIVDYVALLILAKRTIYLNLRDFFVDVIIPSFKSLFVVVSLGYLFYRYFNTPRWHFLLFAILLVVLSVVALYVLVLSKAEKDLVRSILNSKIKK